jgi:hypothetical protein
MKAIIINNREGEHSFVLRNGKWSGLYDNNLSLDEFLFEAALEVSADNYSLPEDYMEQLSNADAYGFCERLNAWTTDTDFLWEFTCTTIPDMLCLNAKETATLLAALRMYQESNESLKDAHQVSDIATNCGEFDALDYEEIETLIYKINYA